jgi:O-antigen/teichoic acid export membrane protein
MEVPKTLDDLRDLFEGDRLAAVFARGASGAFMTRAFGAGLGLVSQIVLARLLGSEQYGVYTYVWTWVLILGLVSTLGFRKLLTRFVASFKTEGEIDRLRGVIRRSTEVVSTVGGMVGIMGAVACYSFRGVIGPELADTFVVGFLLLPLVSLVHLRKEALTGMRWVVRGDIPFRVLRPFLLVLFAGAAWWVWGGQLSALGMMGLTLLMLVIVFGVSTYWLYRALPDTLWEVEARIEGEKWVQRAFPYLLISSAALLQSNVDIVMTGAIVGPEAAGIYKVAARITGILGFALSAMNMIVAPITSELYTNGEMNRLQKVVGWTSLGGFLFTVVGGGVLLGIGPFLLGLFGPAFRDGYTALGILVLARAGFTFAGPTGMLMQMTGREWAASKAFGFGALLNIVSNLVLLPIFGIVGAAIATGISTLAWNSILAYVAISDLKVNPTAAYLLNKFVRGRLRVGR